MEVSRIATISCTFDARRSLLCLPLSLDKYGEHPSTFEVDCISGTGGHRDIGVVPVPKSISSDVINESFASERQRIGVESEAEGIGDTSMRTGDCDCFRVELLVSDGRQLVHLVGEILYHWYPLIAGQIYCREGWGCLTSFLSWVTAHAMQTIDMRRRRVAASTSELEPQAQFIPDGAIILVHSAANGISEVL